MTTKKPKKAEPAVIEQVAPTEPVVPSEALPEVVSPESPVLSVTHSVIAKPERGFRRAGRYWPPVSVEINRGDFDDVQWLTLVTEPQLIIRQL